MAKRRGHGEGSIHQRKDGSWCAIVDLGWVNGKRKRKYLYGKTRKEVADKLKAAYHDQASGVDLASERQTVEEFLKLWLEQTVKVRNRDGTYDNYAQIVRSHITPAIGKYQLTKLTPEQVQAMLNQLTGVGLAPRTVRNVRAVLRDALNQAVKRRRIAYNVAALVEIPRAEKPVITPLTPEQAQALLEAVRGDPLEALYRVALSLGLRRGEVLALRWEDIDFDRHELHVTGSVRRVGGVLRRRSPKTQSSTRTLSLPTILLRILRQHRLRQDQLRQHDDWQENGLVFPSSVGTLMEPGNLHRRFKQVLVHADLPATFRFHDLRHSCATLLLAQGVPLVVVRDTLGHTQISTTADIYGHVLPETHRQAMAGLDALLGENTTEENTPDPDKDVDTEENTPDPDKAVDEDDATPVG
jgi:integrase